MKTIIITLFLIVLTVSSFPTIKFSKEEQKRAIEFWGEKNADEVMPMPIPTLNDKNEIVEDEIEKYYNYIVQEFSKNLTKSTSPVPRAQYGQHPFKYAGKLLFQTSRGQSSCTAVAIGNNAVLTAGHCIHDGTGSYYRNVVFVPQYYQGNGPSGRWSAAQMWTTNEWARGGGRAFARDVGVIKVTPNGGRSLEATVGKTTPVYVRGVGMATICIGYPGNIGGAREMIHSRANQENGDNFSPPTKRISSTMTFGASGGPWFVNGGSNTNGVNSYIRQGSPYLYAPQMDSLIETLVRNAL